MGVLVSLKYNFHVFGVEILNDTTVLGTVLPSPIPKPCLLFFMYSLKCGEWIERRRREHARLEVDDGAKAAHHAAKTMIQRVGNANDRTLKTAICLIASKPTRS